MHLEWQLANVICAMQWCVILFFPRKHWSDWKRNKTARCHPEFGPSYANFNEPVAAWLNKSCLLARRMGPNWLQLWCTLYWVVTRRMVVQSKSLCVAIITQQNISYLLEALIVTLGSESCDIDFFVQKDTESWLKASMLSTKEEEHVDHAIHRHAEHAISIVYHLLTERKHDWKHKSKPNTIDIRRVSYFMELRKRKLSYTSSRHHHHISACPSNPW